MRNKLFIITGFGLVLTSLLMSFIAMQNQKKIAFFDYNEVYNTCDLKLKLEKDLNEVGSLRESELDSLKMELSFLSQKIENNLTSNEELAHFEDLKTRYLTYKQKYEEENIRLKETYFTQIRTEINDKSKMFAKMKGYSFFFAATGDGSLMYADEAEDVTEELKNYLNN